eukprot:6098883-Pyramimonas_sp.AAC.1
MRHQAVLQVSILRGRSEPPITGLKEPPRAYQGIQECEGHVLVNDLVFEHLGLENPPGLGATMEPVCQFRPH